LLIFLFLQIILGIYTLISGLNMYIASAHQITSVLLIFSALNLYYFRVK
jgi:cytochrome c oxidase assembly protein subunit 15